MINVPIDFLKENVNRYKKLARGEKPDCAPFRLWLDNMFACNYTGCPPHEYARDWETMFEVQKKVNDRFYDLRDYSVDAGAMDIYYCEDRFRADQPQARPGRWLERDLDDFDRYFRPKCNFDEMDSVKRLAEGIVYFNSRLPKHKQVSHYFGVPGLMDLFSMFRGTTDFFTDLYDYPDKVERIFSLLCERSLEWLEYVDQRWGGPKEHNNLFDKIDIGEDYCAYMPPDMFDRFVKPYTGRIFEKYKGKVVCSLHTDGDILPRGIHKLGELGIDELMGFSPNVDIKLFREALPDVILGGNIAPISVMIHGTPDDVKKAARYCFETAGKNGKFVLCTGGAISMDAKEENVDAFLESVYEICRY